MMTIWFSEEHNAVNSTYIEDQGWASLASNADLEAARGLLSVFESTDTSFSDDLAVETAYILQSNDSYGSTAYLVSYFDASGNLLAYDSGWSDSWGTGGSGSLTRYQAGTDHDHRILEGSVNLTGSGNDQLVTYEWSTAESFNDSGMPVFQRQVENYGDGARIRETTYDDTGMNMLKQLEYGTDYDGGEFRMTQNYENNQLKEEIIERDFMIEKSVGTEMGMLKLESRVIDPDAKALATDSGPTTGDEPGATKYVFKGTRDEVEQYDDYAMASGGYADPAMTGDSGSETEEPTFETRTVTLFVADDGASVVQSEVVLLQEQGVTDSEQTWISTYDPATGQETDRIERMVESEGSQVLSSYETVWELVDSGDEYGYPYDRMVKEVEVKDGVTTTTTYDENGNRTVSVDLGSADTTPFVATEYLAVVSELYGDSVDSVIVSDSGDEWSSRETTQLIANGSLAGSFDTESYNMGYGSGNEIYYTFYDASGNWIGNASVGDGYYNEYYTKSETRTFNEEDLQYTYDWNPDQPQWVDLNGNMALDTNSTTGVGDQEVEVSVQFSRWGTSPTDIQSEETYVYLKTDGMSGTGGYGGAMGGIGDLIEGTRVEGVKTTVIGPNWSSETTTIDYSGFDTSEDVEFTKPDGTTVAAVQYELSKDGYMAGETETTRVIVEKANPENVLQREEIWSQGDPATDTDWYYNRSTYDGKGQFIGSESRDSNGSVYEYSERVETREIRVIEEDPSGQYLTDAEGEYVTEIKEMQVRVQTNLSIDPYMGGLYSSEYIYSVDDWQFLGGFDINNGRKTVYAQNWTVLSESKDSGLGDDAEYVDVTAADEVPEAVASVVKQKAEVVGDAFEIAGITTQTTTTYFFDADRELIYSAERSTTTTADSAQFSDTTFYDADGHWVGHQSTDSSGRSDRSFRYTDELSEVDLGIDLDGDGLANGTEKQLLEIESGRTATGDQVGREWTYYYEAGNWSLLYGEETQAGMTTVYGRYWEVLETRYDFSEQDLVDVRNTDGDLTGYTVTVVSGGMSDYAMAGQSENVNEFLLDVDGETVLERKEIWRWSEGEGEGRYWSESFSLYDAEGNWIGGGWSDSSGAYSENSEKQITNADGEITGYISEGKDAGNGYSSEYYYEYDATWNLVSGFEIRDGMKYNYGAGWEYLGSEVFVDQDALIEVIEGGAVIGYQLVDSSSSNNGFREAAFERVTNLNTDLEVLSSIETWVWTYDDETTETEVQRYDAEGNLTGSTYEGRDGTSSSYSQVRDEIDGVAVVISAGSSQDASGYEYAYRYVYDTDWDLISAWEQTGNLRVTYDENWNVVSEEVVEDDQTEYVELRDRLDQLVGYETVAITEVALSDTETVTTTRRTAYNPEKEITGFEENELLENGDIYWSEVRNVYDASRKLLSTRSEDSDGWIEDIEWTRTESGAYTEAGFRTEENGVFEWSYSYSADGAFLRGEETYQGVTTFYGADFVFDRKVADTDSLDPIINDAGDITGYQTVVTETTADGVGTYESQYTQTSDFDANGRYLGSTEVWSYSDVYGGSQSGLTEYDASDDLLYGHTTGNSTDGLGSLFVQGDQIVSGNRIRFELSADTDSWGMSYTQRVSGATELDAGFRVSGQAVNFVDTVSNELSDSAEFIPTAFLSTLIRSEGWEVRPNTATETVDTYALGDNTAFADQLAVAQILAEFDVDEFAAVLRDQQSGDITISDSADDGLGQYAMKLGGPVTLLNGAVNTSASRINEITLFEIVEDREVQLASVDDLQISYGALTDALDRAVAESSGVTVEELQTQSYLQIV